MSGCARHAATLIRLPLGCAVCVGAAGGRAVGFHAHRSHTATVALGGTRRFVWGGGRTILLVPGTVLLIAAGSPHATEPLARGVRAVSLSLSPSLMPDLAARGASLVASPELAGAVARLAEERPDASRLRGLAAELAAAPFVAVVPPPPPSPADVRQARARLDAGEPAVGRGAGFGHRFRRYVGLSPTAWRGLARVRRACALLAAGEGLAATAAEAGFFDQSHMTRQFLRFLGMTPGEYRAGAADGIGTVARD